MSLDRLNTQCNSPDKTSLLIVCNDFSFLGCRVSHSFWVFGVLELNWSSIRFFPPVTSFACFLKLQLWELSKAEGKEETWESMTEIMGWIQKQGQMKRQKNWQGGRWIVVCLFYIVLFWLWWWTHSLWNCPVDFCCFLAFVWWAVRNNTENLSL